MKLKEFEIAKNDPNCEIRFGGSSWDQNSNSIKYAWFNKNGKAARGGEFPVEALPQTVRMALEAGYIKPSEIFNG
ncbi:MAG TPA: hypothetical protein DCO86_00915 [Spirochaetaceae bacterium]|nr:hypothetical protein [Spirochaetaceae bacterium]